MQNILELPQEIIELVFSELISSTWAPHSYKIIGPLRLVYRAWVDWIYAHHLYRQLRFGSASQALAFIDHFGRRSRIVLRAKCQYLQVANIWTSEHPPHQRQINYLDNLQLNLFGIPSGLAAADVSSFNTLMMEAQGLRSLTLASPVLLPCKPELMAGIKYPPITHLEVEANKDFDSDALILSISIALKPSVKHLTVHDFAFVTVIPALVPIYETLRETIEVLVVNHGSCLSPILHLMFLALRVPVVHDGLDSFANLLSQGLSSQAPI
ncbi:hypothetical protein PCANC_25921 [Puccinia coronata f. sp. avenae]|uniref:F-box domain-containing protein n=1 Tax=Puccinia coronata f. sp. avenae TaxID=200324 RepID=A0A2N5TJP6_9BASI|nr:hypothetical protein PCANC_25921 [Puccinia coronata f. sp. avenae]